MYTRYNNLFQLKDNSRELYSFNKLIYYYIYIINLTFTHFFSILLILMIFIIRGMSNMEVFDI